MISNIFDSLQVGAANNFDEEDREQLTEALELVMDALEERLEEAGYDFGPLVTLLNGDIEDSSASSEATNDGPLETKTYLVDTKTNEKITEIKDGDVIDEDLVAGRDVGVYTVVENDNGNDVGEVSLDFNNGQAVRTESVAPYALFGDNDSDFLDGNLGSGDHNLSVTYNDGSGNAIQTEAINFTIEGDNNVFSSRGSRKRKRNGGMNSGNNTQSEETNTDTGNNMRNRQRSSNSSNTSSGNYDVSLDIGAANPSGNWRYGVYDGMEGYMWTGDNRYRGQGSGDAIRETFTVNEDGTYDILMDAIRTSETFNRSTDIDDRGVYHADNDIFLTIIEKETGKVVQEKIKAYFNHDMGVAGTSLRFDDHNRGLRDATVRLEAGVEYEIIREGRSNGAVIGDIHFNK